MSESHADLGAYVQCVCVYMYMIIYINTHCVQKLDINPGLQFFQSDNGSSGLSLLISSADSLHFMPFDMFHKTVQIINFF